MPAVGRVSAPAKSLGWRRAGPVEFGADRRVEGGGESEAREADGLLARFLSASMAELALRPKLGSKTKKMAGATL